MSEEQSMDAPAVSQWSIEGEYFENCSCTVVCPCVVSTQAPFTATPTEGVCDVGFAFHLDRGAFGDVSLDNLNLVLIAHIPGPMIEGSWQVGLYLDERADASQQAALTNIFSGQAGGTMGAFAPLIGEVLGAKTVPIHYAMEGKRRSVQIPGIMQMAVRPIPSAIGEDAEMVAVNAHPFAPDGVAMAMGEAGSSWADWNLRWDNSGRNGHYARIQWSNG
jgi:hypothetical protein